MLSGCIPVAALAAIAAVAAGDAAEADVGAEGDDSSELLARVRLAPAPMRFSVGSPPVRMGPVFKMPRGGKGDVGIDGGTDGGRYEASSAAASASSPSEGISTAV